MITMRNQCNALRWEEATAMLNPGCECRMYTEHKGIVLCHEVSGGYIACHTSAGIDMSAHISPTCKLPAAPHGLVM